MTPGSTNRNVKDVPGALPVGSKVGKYEITARLGAGGQSIVYKARDPLLARDVAIKQVAPNLAADERFAGRFMEMSRALAGLRCEEIVTIHDLIEDAGGIFVVMEYVEGHTIESTLASQDGPIEPKAVLQIIWRVAAGLAAIHRAGIIHRDIKPGNLIVGEGLRVKIADFGVAARLGTPASMRLGTTKYMAPELFSSDMVDVRADIYSLGMVAYEMLLGRARFNEVFRDVVRDPHSEPLRWMKWHSAPDQVAPPLAEINPAVPVALSAIVAKMLEKNPDRRFASVEILGREIRSSFSPRGQPQARPGGRSKKRVSVAAAAEAERRGASSVLDMSGEDELALPAGAGETGEPATAAIPKAPMSLTRKLSIAAVLVGIVVAALIVLKSLQQGKQELVAEGATTQYQAAFATFQEASRESDSLAARRNLYEQAAEGFHKVTQIAGAGSVARQAAIREYLSRAHAAMLERNWKDTDQYTQKTHRAIEDMERAEGNRMRKFLSDVQGEMATFAGHFTQNRAYADALGRAQRAIDNTLYDEADTILRGDAATYALWAEQRREIQALRQDIAEKQKQTEYAGHIRAGDDLAKRGNVDAATEEYDKALGVLREAGDDLAPKVRTDLKKAAETKKAILQARAKYAAAVAAAKRGSKKDYLAAADAYENAVKVLSGLEPLVPKEDYAELVKLGEPPDQMLQRARQFRHDHYVNEGRQHLAAGRVQPAQQAFDEALKIIKDSPEAKAELRKIQGMADYADIVKAADKLFRDRSYEAAVEKYREALKMPTASASELAAKIADGQYHIAINNAEAARANREFDKGLAELEKARRAKPANSATIDAMKVEIETDKNYTAQMAAGEAELKAGKWMTALDKFNEAKKLRPTKEVDQKIKEVRYGQNLELGKNSFKVRDFNGAMAYFNLAKGFVSTPEVIQWIEQTQTAMQAAGGE